MKRGEEVWGWFWMVGNMGCVDAPQGGRIFRLCVVVGNYLGVAVKENMSCGGEGELWVTVEGSIYSVCGPGR
jgi:hypothetical protein